jgi:hypothetical protein
MVKAPQNIAVSIKTPCALPCRLDVAHNKTVGCICNCEHDLQHGPKDWRRARGFERDGNSRKGLIIIH